MRPLLTRKRFERLSIEVVDRAVESVRERDEPTQIAAVALDRVRREPAFDSQMVQVRRDGAGCNASVSSVLHRGSMIVCAVRSEASDRYAGPFEVAVSSYRSDQP